MFEIPNGMLAFNENPNDFLLTGDTEVPELPEQDNILHEYNQYLRRETTYACTLYGPIGALSDSLNYEFTDKDIDGVLELARPRGFNPDYGWDTFNGCKTVCDRWNQNKNEKVLFFRLDIMENKIMEALMKGYTVVVGYRGNSEFNMDYQVDNVLNLKELKTMYTYGHCTTMRYNKEKNRLYVKDSAKGNQYNNYDVLRLSDLVKNNVFYSGAYIIIPESLMKTDKEEINRLNQMQLLMQMNIANNSKLWEMTNDEAFKKELHELNNMMRSKLSRIQKQI